MTDEGTQALQPPIASRWVSRLDTGNLLYGTIVSTAALAVGAGRGETAFGMDEAMVTTLIVYWLAHIYIKTVDERYPGSTTPLHRLLRRCWSPCTCIEPTEKAVHPAPATTEPLRTPHVTGVGPGSKRESCRDPRDKHARGTLHWS